MIKQTKNKIKIQEIQQSTVQKLNKCHNWRRQQHIYKKIIMQGSHLSVLPQV